MESEYTTRPRAETSARSPVGESIEPY